MPSPAINQLVDQLLDHYLAQCRVRNSLAESANVHVPPTAEETRAVLAYLKAHGLEGAIVGSVAVLHHLRDTPEAGAFRPTVDLDIFVRAPFQKLRHLSPPEGWRVDPESLGAVSWISPGGGQVDFITSGQEFPNTVGLMPKAITVSPNSPPGMPVAQVRDLFHLKLGSYRAKDLTDLLTLARAQGRAPTPAELGPLNPTQRENLGIINQWLAATAA
jgi:hypothetical protein